MDKPKEHFVYLDMLRGVAAIAVVLLHWFSGFGYAIFGSGGPAVDLFFMLSGFVIAHSYGDRLRDGLSKQKYFVPRIIRLYPMIILGAILGVARVIGAGVLKGDPTDSASLISQFLKNLLLVPSSGIDLAEMFPLNGPIWSLHFEMLAYLAFCAILFKMKSRWIVAALPVAAIAVLDWASVEFGSGPHTSFLYGGIEAYLQGLGRVTLGFCLGVLAYRWRHRVPAAMQYHPIVGIAFLIAVFAVPGHFMAAPTILLIIMAAFPVVVLGGSRVAVSGRFETLAKALGDLSYPLYAIHVPMLWIISGMCKFTGIAVAGVEAYNAIFVVPSVIIASHLIFRYLDVPTRSLLTKSRGVRQLPVRITR